MEAIKSASLKSPNKTQGKRERVYGAAIVDASGVGRAVTQFRIGIDLICLLIRSDRHGAGAVTLLPVSSNSGTNVLTETAFIAPPQYMRSVERGQEGKVT